MERNVRILKNSESLRRGAEELAQRSIDLATRLIATEPEMTVALGGRKAGSEKSD
jgi:hypothetical protein